MGKKLVQKLLPGLQKLQLPAEMKPTAQGQRAYEIGLEAVDSYKGDPKVLVDALGTFRSGQSRPFTCAGIAYVLVAASRESDGSYFPKGLEAAMHWLEKAQETEPDNNLINMIEALIYSYSGRFDDARLVLDYLHQQGPDHYYLNVAEMVLAQQQGEVELAGLWYGKAIQAAINVPQKLRLQTRMGDFYLAQNVLDKALVMFKEAAHFDKDNYQIWHKISLAFYLQNDWEEALRYNQRVLRMNDYPPARQLEAKLQEQLNPDSGSVLGKLFGR
jgi:tetratricopeptide (TPR) repeat protein